MKNWITNFTLALGVFAITLTGCGDDGSSSSTGSGTTEGATTEGATTEGATTEGATTEGATTEGGTTEGGPTVTEACLNEADGAKLEEIDAQAEATTCGLGCIGQGDSCAGDCVTEKTGLTADCAGCFAGIINCTIKNCVGECAADPSSEACNACQAAAGCYQAFCDCSGLTSDACEGGGTEGATTEGGTTEGETTEGGTTEGETTEGGTTEGGTGEAGFEASAKAVFQAACTPCHNAGSANGGFADTFDDTQAAPANTGACGDAATVGECALARMIDGTMPIGGAASSQEDIDTIQAWVDGGMQP